jgi:hypothetical protein
MFLLLLLEFMVKFLFLFLLFNCLLYVNKEIICEYINEVIKYYFPDSNPNYVIRPGKCYSSTLDNTLSYFLHVVYYYYY